MDTTNYEAVDNLHARRAERGVEDPPPETRSQRPHAITPMQLTTVLKERVTKA